MLHASPLECNDIRCCWNGQTTMSVIVGSTAALLDSFTLDYLEKWKTEAEKISSDYILMQNKLNFAIANTSFVAPT